MTDEMKVKIWKAERAQDFYNTLGNLAGVARLVKVRDWFWDRADRKEEEVWNILFYRGV